MELEKQKYKKTDKLKTYASTMDFHTGRKYRLHRSKQDRGDYGRFIRTYMAAIFREIIWGNYHYPLMSALGTLKVEEYYPYAKLTPIVTKDGIEVLNRCGDKVDWKATTKYWKENPGTKEKNILIFYKNEHTNGKKVVFRWDRKYAVFVNKDKYVLNLNVMNKRELAKATFAGTKYFLKNNTRY